MSSADPQRQTKGFSRTVVFVVFAASLILIIFLSPNGLNLTFENNLTIVATSWAATIFAPAAWAFGLIGQRECKVAAAQMPVTIWERFAAFGIDFSGLLIALLSMFALPLIWLEWSATGAFAWSFTREFVPERDFLGIISLVCTIPISVWYFGGLSRRGRATIGQYILGYQIVSSGEVGKRPRFVERTLAAFVGLCIWPITILQYRKRSDGLLWWDQVTHTRAKRTQYFGK